MFRPSFAGLPRPFKVSVVTDTNPAACMATIRTSEFEGAQAYDLHIRRLEKRCQNEEDMRRIVLSTAAPILLINCRDGEGAIIWTGAPIERLI